MRVKALSYNRRERAVERVRSTRRLQKTRTHRIPDIWLFKLSRFCLVPVLCFPSPNPVLWKAKAAVAGQRSFGVRVPLLFQTTGLGWAICGYLRLSQDCIYPGRSVTRAGCVVLRIFDAPCRPPTLSQGTLITQKTCPKMAASPERLPLHPHLHLERCFWRLMTNRSNGSLARGQQIPPPSRGPCSHGAGGCSSNSSIQHPQEVSRKNTACLDVPRGVPHMKAAPKPSPSLHLHLGRVFWKSLFLNCDDGPFQDSLHMEVHANPPAHNTAPCCPLGHGPGCWKRPILDLAAG